MYMGVWKKIMALGLRSSMYMYIYVYMYICVSREVPHGGFILWLDILTDLLLLSTNIIHEILHSWAF